MSESTKAVFLSYASQDAAAVARLADALRAAGVEVWFDQSELVGGDAWDRKIRGQIASCALFLPVISAATQARREGYFRLEWKLAAQRTHMISERTAFLLPVVIDGTRDAEADVPDEFRAVQWTRLAGGETSAAFVARVQKLLDASGATAATAAPVAPTPARVAPVHRSGFPRWAGFALGAVVLALVAFIMLRPGAKDAVPAAKPVAETKPAPVSAPAPAVSAKSIAVLPFTNMSEEKDSAFFADGVHEDILTNLALIPELKVVSRTTVTQYRDTKKTLRQVGEELGVAYILEGSVRRSANKVRVTGQLINARTDEHIWAKKYDRDLTDVFAIQASLADEIATALQAVITPEAKKQIGRRPTENTAAYDAFLKARGIRVGGLRGTLTKAEEFLQTAVDQDPKFAAAWGQLAVTHARFVFNSLDSTPERLARGEAAMANAVRLVPDDPDVMRSVGFFAYYAHRDYAKAIAQFEKIARLQPNDPTVFNALGLIQRRQGRQAESLANLRKAAELDPAGASFLEHFVQSLRYFRRWDEAIAGQRRLLALRSDSAWERRILADDIFWATGSRAERDEFLRREMVAEPNSPRSIYSRMRAAARDDYAEFRRLDAPQPFYDGGGAGTRAERALEWAVVHAAYGNMAAARARLADFPAEFRARLQREPSNPRVHLSLAMAEALLGRREEAVRLAEKATELLPEARDALEGARILALAAEIFAWTGDKDRAIALLTHVISTIGNSPVRALRENPALAPLRGDPRFEALLNDPKNSAPLF